MDKKNIELYIESLSQHVVTLEERMREAKEGLSVEKQIEIRTEMKTLWVVIYNLKAILRSS